MIEKSYILFDHADASIILKNNIFSFLGPFFFFFFFCEVDAATRDKDLMMSYLLVHSVDISGRPRSDKYPI